MNTTVEIGTRSGVTHHNIPARPDRTDAASFPHRGAHLTSLGTISRRSRDYRVKMAMAFAVMIDESRREVVAIEEPLGRPLIRLGGLNLVGIVAEADAADS